MSLPLRCDFHTARRRRERARQLEMLLWDHGDPGKGTQGVIRYLKYYLDTREEKKKTKQNRHINYSPESAALEYWKQSANSVQMSQVRLKHGNGSGVSSGAESRGAVHPGRHPAHTALCWSPTANRDLCLQIALLVLKTFKMPSLIQSDFFFPQQVAK